jgi:sterol desaturase/sphingolipid hydroxylase (fatty acid hydroxylase superfamily)
MLKHLLADFDAWLGAGPLGSLPLLPGLLKTVAAALFSPLTEVTSPHAWWLVAIDLVLIAGLFFLVQRPGAPQGQPGDFLGFCFPRRILTHPSTRTDLKLYFVGAVVSPLTRLFWRFNAILVAGVLLQGLIALAGPAPRVLTWGWGSGLIVAFAIAIGRDLGFYACHLAHHRIPALWAFHKVHHSAEVMTPLAAKRNHPVELALIPPCDAMGTALILAPVLYLFATPPSPIELFGVSLVTVVFAGLGAHLYHSHIWLVWPAWLQRLILCPAQHHIHHSSAPRHHDKNMANMFTFWDWLFGTLYIAPKTREAFRLGVYGAAVQLHPGVLAAYLVPFADAARAVRPWLPAPLRPRLGAWADALESRCNDRLGPGSPVGAESRSAAAS